MTTSELLSPGLVAKRLKLSTSRVLQLDREGHLPAMRDRAGRRLYDCEAVDRFARERESLRDARIVSMGSGEQCHATR